MKLTYRGIHYTHSPSIPNIANIPVSNPIIGQYRGATLSINQHKQSAESQLAVNLQYRGALYYSVLRHYSYLTSTMGYI